MIVSTTLKRPVRFILQHCMNSLHVYSFLCRMNMSEEKALNAVKVYERVVHPFLYIRKHK